MDSDTVEDQQNLSKNGKKYIHQHAAGSHDKREFQKLNQDDQRNTQSQLRGIDEWSNRRSSNNSNKQQSIKNAIIVMTVLACIFGFFLYKNQDFDNRLQLEGLCKANKMRVETLENQYYETFGEYKFTSTPFPKVKLLSKKGDPSPTYHFAELIPYFKKYPASKIYVHSASVYFVLMIGAFTAQNNFIIIAHDFPEKKLLQTAFILNNIRGKLVFEDPTEIPFNIEIADVLVSLSSEFVARYPSKPSLLYTDKETKNPNPNNIYKLSSSSCSQKIAPIQSASITEGLHLVMDIRQYSLKANQNAIAKHIYSKVTTDAAALVCTKDSVANWSPSQSQAYKTGDYRVQKTPYSRINLMVGLSDPSPTYHFSELVTYLHKNPLQSPIYLHSAPVYIVALIGASVSQNSTIIVAHDFSEKSLLRKNFVLNNLKGNLIFQDPKDTYANIRSARVLVSLSTTFIEKYPTKNALLYVQQSQINPNESQIYRLKQKKPCGLVYTVNDQRQFLTNGLYIKFAQKNKLQASLNQIQPKFQSNEFSALVCSIDELKNWSPAKASVYQLQSKGQYKIQKTPYPQVNLVSMKNSPSPTQHYPELVSYLRKSPIQYAVYVQSAPAYFVLLIGVLTSKNVIIIIANDFQDKWLLKTNFALNNINHKLIFEKPKNSYASILKADILVSNSVDFINKYPQKTSIFYVEQQSLNPSKISTYKLNQAQPCGNLQRKLDSSEILSHGLYQKAGNFNLICQKDTLKNWRSGIVAEFQINGGFKVQTMPYPLLSLVLKQDEPSPTNHYPELVSYLQQYPVNGAVYVHSASAYFILLLGAVTKKSISIIVASGFKGKEALRNSFKINHIKSKLVFQNPKDTHSNIRAADFLVSQSSKFIARYPAKTGFLYVSQQQKNPSQLKVIRLTQKQPCGDVQKTLQENSVLQNGLYLTKLQQEQPKQDKGSLKRTQVPKLVCNADQFKNWTPSAYQEKGVYKVQKTPYPRISLFTPIGEPSPKNHFTELTTYLKQSPVKSSVYVQSGSVYTILLIGAAISDKVKIFVAHDFPEQKLLKTNFVMNNLLHKLVFEDQKDAKMHIYQSEILFSQSTDFIARNPRKTAIFYVDFQSKSPNTKQTFKLIQAQPCDEARSSRDIRQTLDHGLYVIKLQNTYIPNLSCNSIFNSQVYQEKGSYKIQRTPFAQISLISKNAESPSTSHFPELVTYLQDNPIKSSVYVHSASVYAILLVGAATSADVTIIVAHDFKEKNLLKTNFFVNNLKDKIVFQEPEDTAANIIRASVLISQDRAFIGKYSIKTYILEVVQPNKIPNLKSLYRISSQSPCFETQLVASRNGYLSNGFYLKLSQNKQIVGQNMKTITIQKPQEPNLPCKKESILGWTAKVKQISSNGKLYILKTPYPLINLILQTGEPTPTYHFTELVTYLNQQNYKSSVYVHSASIYSALLTAAASPASAIVVIAADFPNKKILKKNIILNNLGNKVVFQESKDTQANIENSEILLSQSSDFIARYPVKTSLLHLQNKSENPNKKGTYHLVQVEACGNLTGFIAQTQILNPGLYLTSP